MESRHVPWIAALLVAAMLVPASPASAAVSVRAVTRRAGAYARRPIITARSFLVQPVPGQDYTLVLQAAVDRATPGRILVVPAGRHEIGSIRIWKPLTLSGQGAGLTLLVARDGTDRTLLRVEDAGQVTVRDLSIDGNRSGQAGGYPHGIQFSGSPGGRVLRTSIRNCVRSGISIYARSDGVIVEDSDFLDNENDVEIHGSAHCRVLGNRAVLTRYESYACYEEADGPGDCHGNLIEGNTSRDAYCGVNVERSGGNTVRGNTATNTHYGLHVSGGGGTLTTGNLLEGNTVTGGERSTAYGVVVEDGAAGNVLKGNTVTGWLGTAWSVCVGNQVLP